MTKYKVILTKQNRKYLLGVIKSGQHSSKTIIHALVLLNCDEGILNNKFTNEDIAKILKTGMRTIDRIKKKFVEEGFEIALRGNLTRKVYEKKTDKNVESKLLKLITTKAPQGFSRWTYRLLAKKMVELKYVESISHETVRNIFKKTT